MTLHTPCFGDHRIAVKIILTVSSTIARCADILVHMPFHSDFWVLAGTASPVIALAAVVTMGDRLSLRSAANHKEGGDEQQIKALNLAYRLSRINFSLQSVVLGASFLSLDQEKDFFPPIIITCCEIGGMILLGFSSTSIAREKVRTLHEPPEDN